MDKETLDFSKEIENQISNDEFVNGEEDDIVVMIDSEGNEMEFIQIAGIAHEGNFYAIMQPVILLEGMAEDEALVFLVEGQGEEDVRYSVVLQEQIIDAVFAKYNALLDKYSEDKKN